MNLRIEKLTAGMGETFAEYFRNLNFSHEPHWAGGYCRFYFSKWNWEKEEWQNRAAEVNRQEAVAEIDDGNMSGLLAFDGDKCIGWLNANDWSKLKLIEEYISEFIHDKKVGVTICFVIHPDYRNKGVATALLNAAIEDFKKQGYDAVLAIPVYSETFSQKMYRGTISMYEKAGFKRIGEFGDFGDNRVYWLELK